MPKRFTTYPLLRVRSEDIDEEPLKSILRDIENYMSQLLMDMGAYPEDHLDDNVVTRSKLDDDQAKEIVGFELATPGAAANLGLFFTREAITITGFRVVIAGTSLTVRLCHSTDRTAGAPNYACTAQAITNTTTGADVTLDGDVTVPANSWVWFITTAATACTLVTATVEFDKDG